MTPVPVLVLNASYEPLSVVETDRAVVLLLQGKATSVIDTDEVFSSAHMSLFVPSVIRLTQMRNVPRQRGVPLSRRALFARDNHRCQYCGRSDLKLTVEHIKPRSKGGKNTWTNVTAACTPCNAYKRDRTPEEAGMTLLSKPYAPTKANMIAARGHADWAQFLAQQGHDT